MEENVKKIKVGVFGLYYPHYRNGVFAKLSNTPGFTFKFHGANSAKGTFLDVDPKKYKYDFVNILTRRIKIPIVHKTITIQPYAEWAMISRKFDVFIMTHDTLRPSIWCNLFLSRLMGCKVCLWGQGKSYPPNKTTWFLRKIMFSLAHSVIFYTEGVRQEWVNEGLPPEKLFVAHNALDTDLSNSISEKTTREDLDNFMSKNNLQGKDLILFSGRLILDWKKPHVLIEAMKHVVARHPSAHLVIIGDGPDKGFLEKLIKDIGLSGCVTIAGGVYEENIISLYMLASKIFVIPGKGGLGIQHGMGYGLPVITNDNIANQSPEIELLVDGVTGKFCKEDDVKDFAEAIIYLLENEAKRKELSQNALKMIQEKYNVDNMAKGILDAIKWSFRL